MYDEEYSPVPFNYPVQLANSSKGVAIERACESLKCYSTATSVESRFE